MIVRIFSDNQYRVPDAAHDRLNALDADCVAAVAAGDDERFHAAYAELLALIRTEGQPLRDDELEPSDVMFPPPDVTLDEARQEFTGEGLIPD
jgi:hypothetical protein